MDIDKLTDEIQNVLAKYNINIGEIDEVLNSCSKEIKSRTNICKVNTN